MKKDIFITGTFRNEWNRSFNTKLADLFATEGISIFLPQRDSEQLGNRKETFLQDIAGIDSSKIIVAVGSKTQTANWGFELGYAYAKKQPVIILTDEGHPVELMPEVSAQKIFVVKDLDSLESWKDELVLAVKDYLDK